MELVKELIDTVPYVWWKEGESTMEKEAPFYCKSIPSIQTIQKEGCNCAGLINLIQLSNGLKVPGVQSESIYAGGTYVWYDFLDSLGLLEPIDRTKSYPEGSLLLRNYKTEEDQGHVAILYSSGPLLEQKLLHCYPDVGITIDSTVNESDSWITGEYYERICPNWIHLKLDPIL
jgi:hypothetical protein